MSDNSAEQGNVRLTVIALVSLGIAVLVIIIAVSTLSGQIAGAVIAGLGAVMASVLSIIVSKHWEKRLDIEQEHRKQKIPVYEEFLISWFISTLSAKHARTGEPEKGPSFMFQFAVKIW